MHVAQRRRHIAAGQAKGKALDHRSLAHAGLAGQNGIVLPPAHQNIDHLTNLLIAAEHRIDLARLGVGRQVTVY